jgi:hypothetical protein
MAEPFEPTAPSTARPFLEFRPLLRAVGIASDAKKLILATIGLLALSLGWSALATVFGASNARFSPIPPGSEIEAIHGFSMNSWRDVALMVTEPFRVVVTPFTALFARRMGPGAWFQSALMAVWAVVVWGIFGGAIARIAVVQATGSGRVGLRSAVRFAIGKSASLIGAPLTPLLAVGLFAGSCGLFGLLYRIPWGIGPTIAAFLGFVPLLLGLIMAIILIGLAIGWPLMHATVAAEGEDAPDALSRSYSYVNQRMARYLAHALVSWVIGTIGLAVAILFAGAVIILSGWGVGLGAPDSFPSNELADSIGAVWARLVGVLVHAWVYSYFWSASTLIYLILRRDVDGTPWHDVYLPEQAADTFADAPAPSAPVESPEPVETRPG